jgi:hypothetical protein
LFTNCLRVTCHPMFLTRVTARNTREGWRPCSQLKPVLHHSSPSVSSLPSISHRLHNSTKGGDRSNPDGKIAWKGWQSSWCPARAFVRVPMVCLAVLAAIIGDLAACASKFGRALARACTAFAQVRYWSRGLLLCSASVI